MTHHIKWLTAVLVAMLWAPLTLGQEAEDKEKEESIEEKTIAELIEGDAEFAGLFTFYRDRETGETTLLLQQDQLVLLKQ